MTFVALEGSPRAFKEMKRLNCGQQVAIIGEVLPEPKGEVFMKTRVGGTRIVDMLSGEQFPRIC